MKLSENKGIFITATGTDIGKTYITSLILKELRESNINAGYYKAALSGAENINGKLVPGDAEYVCNIAEIEEDTRNLVSYIYEDALSPHLAANISNIPISLSKIDNDFKKIKSKYEYVVVEGSGGIVCPLRLDDEIIMLSDVIKMFNLELLIVASSSVGTINSTVLTVEYAKNMGIQVKGIILNNYEVGNYVHEDNKKQIELLTKIPVIAYVSKNDEKLDIELDHLLKVFKSI